MPRPNLQAEKKREFYADRGLGLSRERPVERARI